MLTCPKCSSRELKVLPLKPRDMPDGKTRSRQCTKCKTKFTTIETVIIIPPIEKPKPKPKPRKQLKRKLKPRLRIVPNEPDFASMTDAEIEAYFYD
jgi:transcriptional regulator NrdR family protein|tara:strand:- start:75 stop:362 length:288 start_codon:yes stop_codon:yes gene_type:complete